MTVGVLAIRLAIREARDLKGKRRIVKSLKDRIRDRFNVSVAEVGRQDARQHSELAVAVVASDRRFADQVLGQVANLVRSSPWVQVVDYSVEMY
jgi:uncharacterized protein YlxP (DUF503 family)